MKKVIRKDSLGHDEEYQRQLAEWFGPDGKLAKSGFHDIEKEDGSLEQDAHIYELNDQVHHENSAVFELIPVDQFNSAMHRFNFQSKTDHDICHYLASGATFKQINAAIGVGQGRIERVREQLKGWHDVGFNLLSDVE